MKKTLKCAAALTILAAVILPAFAAEEPTEEITVFAPFVVKKAPAGRSRYPVTQVTATQGVNFHDLDMSQPGADAKLQERVRLAAENICRTLNRRYPPRIFIPVSSNENCVQDAITEAMVQVRNVEAAAKG